MELHGIPIGSIWTAIKSLPPFFLKRFFPKEKLAALMYVDLRPRHESAMVNLGESATFDIWLNLINLSPFVVELDRAEFRFTYGGNPIKASILKKQNISPGEIATLHISEVIPDGQANQMARSHRVNTGNIDGWLDGFMEFNCKLHAFTKNVGNLSGIKPHIVNEIFRAEKVST